MQITLLVLEQMSHQKYGKKTTRQLHVQQIILLGQVFQPKVDYGIAEKFGEDFNLAIW